MNLSFLKEVGLKEKYQLFPLTLSLFFHCSLFLLKCLKLFCCLQKFKMKNTVCVFLYYNYNTSLEIHQESAHYECHLVQEAFCPGTFFLCVINTFGFCTLVPNIKCKGIQAHQETTSRLRGNICSRSSVLFHSFSLA